MKIVVGYDGSDAAKNALGAAKKQAKAFDGKIYILMCLVGEMGETAVHMAKGELDRAVKFVENWGIPCESQLITDGTEPGQVIVNFAREIEAEEIVIGIHKMSKVQKFLLGSNAQHVLLQANCMVLAVK